MTTTINMPQMAANGLSENWLFRHCGDTHWQALCASVGVRSAALLDDQGARLYPTFVAIAARYSTPLSSVDENEEYETKVDLSHFGQSFFRSMVTFASAQRTFEMEMLTAFAARDTADRNSLRKSTPSSSLKYTSKPLGEAPAILKSAKQLRRGELASYDFSDYQFNLSQPGLNHLLEYEPSPYFDFNGANLLYFAAYPTMVDTLERRIIMRERLTPDARDWALATSTIARDVFYYRNLDLGERVRARLRTLTPKGDLLLLHTTLVATLDDAPIADVFTAKRLLVSPSPPAEGKKT